MKRSLAIVLVVIFTLLCLQAIAFAEEAPPEVIEQAVLEEIPAEDIPIAEEAAEPAEAAPDIEEFAAAESASTGLSVANREEQFKALIDGASTSQKGIWPAPQNFFALPENSTTLWLTWDIVPVARYGYSIYCWTNNYDGRIIAEPGQFYDNYYHSYLQPGVRYYYMMAAIEPDGSLGQVAGPISNVTRNRISPPQNIKAQSNSYDSILLTWTPDSSAYGYVVFCGTSPSNTEIIYSGTDNTVNGVKVNETDTGVRYYFFVYSLDHYKDLSTRPPAVSAVSQVSKPTGVKATAQAGKKIALSWSRSAGASGYYIYRAASKTGTYSLIKTVGASTASFTNTGLTAGKTYYYKIVPYRTVSGSKLKGATSAVVYAKAKA